MTCIILNPKGIVVYSTVWCPDCKRAKQFFGEQRVAYTNVDIEQDKKALAFVEKINEGLAHYSNHRFSRW